MCSRVFWIWLHFVIVWARTVRLPVVRPRVDSLAEQVGLAPAVHLPFEHLDPVDGAPSTAAELCGRVRPLSTAA